MSLSRSFWTAAGCFTLAVGSIGIDVELANWRSVVAAPGISDDQKKALVAAVDAMHASDAWKKILADKKWIDLYQSGDEFGVFLKAENERVAGVLKTIGLVK